MAAFEYTALDLRGRQVRGVLEGDTPRHVRQQLRERQLTPLGVDMVRERSDARVAGFSLRRGLSATDLALFTRQLATLVRAGLPLAEALGAIAEQSEKARIKSMLLGVRAKVVEGHTLADGLGEFPRAFPEIYRATVAAGEQSGYLDKVLERLADYTEARQALRQKVGLAMVYPIILVILALVIVAGLMVFVVPKLLAVLENTGQDLPALTVGLVAISDFLRAYGLYLIIVLVAAGFLWMRMLRNPSVRRWYHARLLRTILVGRVVKGANAARFARTLAILVGSGVPVLEALRIAGEVITNLPMREAVADTADRVREGAPIAASLADAQVFPAMLIHLIRSGEQSGELGEMLDRAASNQERELESVVGTLVGVLEPLLLLVMGAIVMLIVAAMLMPIYQNYQALQ